MSKQTIEIRFTNDTILRLDNFKSFTETGNFVAVVLESGNTVNINLDNINYLYVYSVEDSDELNSDV